MLATMMKLEQPRRSRRRRVQSGWPQPDTHRAHWYRTAVLTPVHFVRLFPSVYLMTPLSKSHP